MPFAGYMPSYAASLAAIYSCWFLFPREWRKNKKFSTRLRWASVAVVLSFFIFATAYVGLALLFLVIPADYQWAMALILPVVREIFTFAVDFAAVRAAGHEYTSVKISAEHSVTSKNIAKSSLYWYCCTVSTGQYIPKSRKTVTLMLLPLNSFYYFYCHYYYY